MVSVPMPYGKVEEKYYFVRCEAAGENLGTLGTVIFKISIRKGIQLGVGKEFHRQT